MTTFLFRLQTTSKKYNNKGISFYVETYVLLIFENVSVFRYNINGLDGMRGRHSIWRRWGRYQGRVLIYLFVKTILFTSKSFFES